MDITVKAFSSPLLANALSYLVSVKKSGGRDNEYVVEIKRLPTMIQNCFGCYWSGYYLQYYCWLVDFYPYDALFSSEPGARYKVDRRMAFSYSELIRFLAEGVGQAVESFLQHQLVASLLAMPIHPALGKMYHRLLRRYAAEKGFIYNQTWLQEAVYVIEKK